MGGRSGDDRSQAPALIEVDFSPEALVDLDEAYARYLAVSPRLGHAFLDEVAHAEGRLRARLAHVRPAVGVDRALDVQRALLRRFPYVLYLLERPYGWHVIAVGHGHRRPGHWRDRLR